MALMQFGQISKKQALNKRFSSLPIDACLPSGIFKGFDASNSSPQISHLNAFNVMLLSPFWVIEKRDYNNLHCLLLSLNPKIIPIINGTISEENAIKFFTIFTSNGILNIAHSISVLHPIIPTAKPITENVQAITTCCFIPYFFDIFIAAAIIIPVAICAAIQPTGKNR